MGGRDCLHLQLAHSLGAIPPHATRTVVLARSLAPLALALGLHLQGRRVRYLYYSTTRSVAADFTVTRNQCLGDDKSRRFIWIKISYIKLTVIHKFAIFIASKLLL